MIFTSKKDKNEILNTLIHFKKDIFDKSVTEEQLTVLADKFSKYAVFIVAEDNNSEVGYVAFYCNDTVNKNAFISMIIVGSEYQGCGYGRKLLARVIELGESADMLAVKLEVSKKNNNAIGFYEKMGFAVENECETQYTLIKAI